MLNKTIAFFALFFVSVGFASSLEMTRGKIKVVVNENNARFSLYYSDDLANPAYTPLFSSDDPTTSKIKVQLDGRVYTLGEDRDFALSVESIPTGARATWESKTLRIVQSFEFLTSVSSTVVDGLKMTFVLTNRNEGATIKPALRYVLDTNLGEKKDHFVLPGDIKIASETKLESPYPDFWVSPSSLDEKIGLLFMLNKNATSPSRVVFSNWKRLNESSWDSGFKQGREFNLLPYNFNDSAVAVYYDGVDINPGQSREIVMLLGNRSVGTLNGAKTGSASALNDILDTSRSKDVSSLEKALDQDRQTLEDALKQLNEKLKTPEKVTEEDLKLLQAILDQLEQRKSIYQTSATK